MEMKGRLLMDKGGGRVVKKKRQEFSQMKAGLFVKCFYNG